MSPIWDPGHECMQREHMQALQLERLQGTVAWTFEHVAYYRDQLEERGVTPADIRTLDDISLLPFTDKTALRDTYPFGMFAVPMDQIVRLHSSSGTTGKPIVVGYDAHDLDLWTDLMARVVSLATVDHTDRVQIAFLYGMFTGGWGLHYGSERVGATVIPAGAGNTERQLMMMQDFGSTALVSTPSYALYLAEAGEALGVDFEKLPLRVGLFGGEPCSGSLKKEIEERMHILATDNYGLSEVMGPGVAGECGYGGMHFAEDHLYWEILDPDTQQPLPPGEKGELVITTLTKRAFPLFRYRTHDLTAMHLEPCECGRTTARMEKVRQRTDDMLIIRGVNVFPSQIEDAIWRVEGTRPHYVIVVDQVKGLDTIEIQIEIEETAFFDKMAEMEDFRRRIGEQVQTITGLRAKIVPVEPGTIERTQGKAKHVIDKRP